MAFSYSYFYSINFNLLIFELWGDYDLGSLIAYINLIDTFYISSNLKYYTMDYK
jgi:hypothetical protein